MDIAAYLQCFESRFSSYTGDDPLDPWDKFVEYLEQRLPADGGSGMSVVFDTLVQRFMSVERYADDIRYVNYCIKCASYYSDPVALYSHVFSKGIGTRTAALYLAWAQQFEQRGLNEQADAVYQKATENQAQPAETVLHEYRQFQARTRSQTPGSAGGRNPLQNSHLTNQMSSHREPAAQSKASVDGLSKPAAVQTTIIVSRSETSGAFPSGHSAGVQLVSEYMTDELVCEGSEFCFEEVRAARYFRQLQDRQEKEQRETMERRLREHEEGIRNMESMLQQLDQDLQACGGLSSRPPSHRPPVVDPAPALSSDPLQHFAARPRPSNRLSSRRSLGLRLHAEPTFIQEAAAAAATAPVVFVPDLLPLQQNHIRPVETSALSSEVSHHPAVLADRSVHLPQESDPTSMVQQMNLSLHRPAVASVTAQPNSWENRQPPEHNTTHQDINQLQEPEEKLDVSQGASVNLSHVTPNTSLGFVQATPSRVLPSPTVNTREALDVIMDMFQAPTLLEDPFSKTSALHTEADGGYQRYAGASSFSHPRPPAAAAAPFTIFQDDNDKENGRAAAPSAAEKQKPVRALAEIPASKTDKPNDTPLDLMPDESTMWGAQYNSLHSLAACPNSTTDFALLAQFVSTPFTHKTPVNSAFFQDQENDCDGGDADEDAFIRRQTKKLSPIIEQSPCDEKLSETTVSQLVPSSERQGTIVGEGHLLLTSSSSSITMVQPPPPAVLSFRDHTLCSAAAAAADSSSCSRSAGPGWDVYSSPEPPPPPPASTRTSLLPHKPRTETFKILEEEEDEEDEEEELVQNPGCDVPMSPACAPKPNWLGSRSPRVTVEPDLDLDAFVSPRRGAGAAHNRTQQDVPMSPEQNPLCADVPMSPAAAAAPPPPPFSTVDEPMMSPDRGQTSHADVSMNASSSALRAGRLVSDPWDNDLINDLLSSLAPPLTSHPRCVTWPCSVPNISPKTTISMGRASLQVDCVLGEGAFATVYQATDPRTSEKMVLKVQKPANPWEFYINTQLDARLPHGVRHLFSSMRSAHLFHNGSVLLGEVHSHGTLLNAVNMYKTLSDKLMPQPLVMYFAVCILHMVEQLHAVGIVHADIKPDNFLLGDRFLDNKSFEAENVDHGLVLIDLGQSIDMELFPQGTAFTAKCLTSGFQCTEMLSGKPWNYQTDYFGIAGTVHCLLFGTYMQVTNEDGVWKSNAVFRRNPHSDLWSDFFHTLLNVPSCDHRPSLRSLRLRLTAALQENYDRKLPTLKSRLVVLLLENRKAARR